MMKHVKRFVLGLAIMLFAFGFTPYYVHAGLTDPEIVLSADAGTISGLISKINSEYKEITGKKEFMKVEDKTVYLMKEDYNLLPQKQKEETMTMVLEKIAGSSLPSKERTRLYNFVAEQDTAVSSMVRQLSTDVSADFARGYSWFKPVSGVLRGAMGFIALVTASLFGLSITMDLCYLTIPPLQLALDSFGKNKDRKRPPFVSYEAYKSAEEAEGSNGDKTSINLYAGKALKKFFVVGLALLYLSSGNLYKVLAWVFDVLGGLLPQF